MLISQLGDVLKRRGVRRVQYFHTDHFEPWSKGVNADTAKGVERFAQLTRQSKFAGSMNLFYHTHLPYRLDAALASKGEAGVDAVVLGERSAQQGDITRRAMLPLETQFGHEVHIHVHHESWTRNTGEYSKDISRWVNTNSSEAMDRARLDLGLRLTKEYISHDIGRPIEKWAFVHGNWALNGSDRSICWVDDEIELLMAHGCFGDFTFPAGRGHCDPASVLEPYTCVPVHHAKGYDTPDAKALTIRAGADPLESGRFFIWNSEIKANYSSLDYYSPSNRELFKTPERVVGQWLEKSVVMGDCLFIKTHAHSMKWEYEIDKGENPIPHLYPDTLAIFALLESVCNAAAVPIEVVTVNQLMAQLQAQALAVRAAESAQSVSEVAPMAGPPSLDDIVPKLGGAMRSWLDGSEERDYAAGDFYRQRINAGVWLEGYERAIVDHVVTHFPVETTKVTEVGVGLGALTLVLAAMGYEVCAFEGDAGRSAGARWLREQLTGQFPSLAENYTIVEGFYPDAMPKGLVDDRKTNVLVTTNLVNTFSAQNQDRILRSALQFNAFILDVSRFGLIRSTDGAAHTIIEALNGHFDRLREVWTEGSVVISEFVPKSPLQVAISQLRTRVPAAKVLQSATPVVEQWLAELLAGGGKDGFFADKLARGQLLDRREVAVATQMCALFNPETTRIVEIGSAVGALALLLAANGFDVLGFEGGARRKQASDLVKKQWLADHPEEVLALTFECELFPRGFSGASLASDRRNVLLATNIVGTYSAEHQEAMLLAAASFDDVVIDVGRFGVSRDQLAQRHELLHAMSSTHFEPQRLVFYAEPNEVWHFRVRRALSS